MLLFACGKKIAMGEGVVYLDLKLALTIIRVCLHFLIGKIVSGN